ncbi:hypothetical protein ACOTTU_07200 [Roseobacter sp. EG26]
MLSKLATVAFLAVFIGSSPYFPGPDQNPQAGPCDPSVSNCL